MENNVSAKKIKCPTCRKETTWTGNPHRPFCSERCRLIDLGKWADDSYSIESEDSPSTNSEEI